MVSELRKEISNFFEINHNKIIFFDRAFMSLFCLFKFLSKQSKRKKILFTSSTCQSPVLACYFANLKPIFSDISLDNFLMNSKETLEIIENEKNDILAVVYVYLFGNTPEPKSLNSIKSKCKLNNIFLIEDVAQAFGAKCGNIKCGLIGDFSVFSFGYSKQIDGNGGGFLINNIDINQNVDINKIKINYPYLFNKKQINFKKKFYQIRKKSLKNINYLNDYMSLFDQSKVLYFKKLNPDWDIIYHKLIAYNNNNMTLIRNDNASKYEYEIIKLGLDEYINVPKVNSNYSTYRYTILIDKLHSVSLSNILRDNEIDCSNLYIPIGNVFSGENFSNSVSLFQKSINLWVTPVEFARNFDKTINILKKYFE